MSEMAASRTDNSDPRPGVYGLLLDIFERMGSIEQQLKSGARTHEQFRMDLHELKAKLGPLEQAAVTVKRMEPIVDDYDKSKQRTVGILLAMSGLASGFGFFASEIKGWFFKH